MDPVLLWILVFGLGGLAMGVITALVGLPKGVEIWFWLGLYAFMTALVSLLAVPHPFLTLLLGSLLAGAVTSAVQVAALPLYRKNNPWYAKDMDESWGKTARGFVLFAMLAALLFGLAWGTIAWLISLA